MKYAPKPFKQWAMNDWAGVERHLRAKAYISIGWRLSKREVGIWLTVGGDTEFGSDSGEGVEAPASDVAGLERLLGLFWEFHHSEG